MTGVWMFSAYYFGWNSARTFRRFDHDAHDTQGTRIYLVQEVSISYTRATYLICSLLFNDADEHDFPIRARCLRHSTLVPMLLAS